MLKDHAKSGKLRVKVRARSGVVTQRALFELATRLEAATLGFDIVGDPETYYAIVGVKTELRRLAMQTATPAPEHPHTKVLRAVDGIICDDRISDTRALVKINTIVMEALNAK